MERELYQLAETAAKIIDSLQTEAATSTALVLPMLRILGYDVFNPLEVIPEFTADVGTKKGEKVDYAIQLQNVPGPVMLFEVKHCKVNLDEVHFSQLYRYFSVTPARIGILTNGIIYRFFTDLDDKNKMDPKPYFEFSLSDIRPDTITQLQKYTKENFDPEAITSAASELKYLNGMKKYLLEEFTNPSIEMTKLVGKEVHKGPFTQKVTEQFQPLLKRAFAQLIQERVHQRLTSALQNESEATHEPEERELPEGVVSMDGDIVTTEEELEGVRIVKAIASQFVEPERVVMRDTKSYCGILLDDNNRKPICRLHFNRTQRYLGVLDLEKNETRIPIEKITDIYRHQQSILATIQNYLAE